MSCSAPGTNGPPEMKTVRNSVLLRLSLAYSSGSLKVITGHSRLCLSKPTPAAPGTTSSLPPLQRGLHRSAGPETPRAAPTACQGRGRLGERLQQEGLSSLPDPHRGPGRFPCGPSPPPPALVLLASSAPTEEWGATASCFLATQHTSGQWCTNHFAGKIIMLMEYLRGCGFTRKQFHCVDVREWGKP